MVFIGKSEFLFDITYFFGSNKNNEYVKIENDCGLQEIEEIIIPQLSKNSGDVVILTHNESVLENSLCDRGFRKSINYFFFDALKGAFLEKLHKHDVSNAECFDLWEIYKTIFYSHHNKYRPCHHPLFEAEITENGDVCTCCSAILPFSIGNITQSDLFSVWHSKRAELLRLSVLNGTAIFCSQARCGNLQLSTSSFLDEKPQLSDYPLIVNIAVDSTCNLSCPSCRKNKIVENKENILQKNIWLQQLDKAFYENVSDLYVAGNGECMISLVYKTFLLDCVLTNYSGNLHLVTNGQIWNAEIIEPIISKFQPEILVSVDACTKETYEKLRCGGKYEKIIENIQKYVDLLTKNKLSGVTVRFVVQKSNYLEIPQFIIDMRNLGVTRIEFTRLVNGGSFCSGSFEGNSLLDNNGLLRSEYLPFFFHSVWPLLSSDIFMDCAYLPR